MGAMNEEISNLFKVFICKKINILKTFWKVFEIFFFLKTCTDQGMLSMKYTTDFANRGWFRIQVLLILLIYWP